MLPLIMLALPTTAAEPFTPYANLAKPYLLPAYRTVSVASESSYDRTGGNDDGFSGKYSFLRKEGDSLVICELTGPGVVQRFTTPLPSEHLLEFYFDGEDQPRISAPFRAFFMGDHRGFPKPLVGHGVGGFYSYVPIPYAKSLKIVYRAPVMYFFQINHVRLPEGSTVKSWTSLDEADSVERHAACDFLGRTGEDISARMAPPGAALKTETSRRSLEPGRRTTVFEARRGGRIVGLRLRPASELAGKDRAIVLRATFDGARKPNVLCPAGDFFGASWGQPAVRSLLLGNDGETAYSYLPMPFERSARIELISERKTGPAIPIEAEVVWCDAPKTAAEGRFYAVWRRENPTTTGKPFTFVSGQGRGHIVGVALQAQGAEPGSTPFFEGDDQATLDGQLTVHGTGSEDFFNGGWYDVPGRWDARRSLPLSGCLDYKKHLARTGGFRFMLPDPYVFQKSVLLTIEHAPERNDLPTDYAGVTYLYADRSPDDAGTLPPVEARAVADPPRIVFATGWSIPLHAFSLQNATLTKRTIRAQGHDHRCLSLRATGGDIFGDHFVQPVCDVPAAGTYAVKIEAVAGPECGMVQLGLGEAPVGVKADLHAAEPVLKTIELATVTLQEGPNPILLKLTGSGPNSAVIGIDLARIILEKR